MRRLSARERLLLLILCLLLAGSAYLYLFYMPMAAKRAELEAGILAAEDGLLECQIKTEKKTRMRQELQALFAGEKEPAEMASYDNLQAVMFELNRILKESEEYDLNFNVVDTGEALVRRSISLRFSSRDYAAAERILKNLHDGAYRCMLDDLELRQERPEDPRVNVSATIVFFEYQKTK